MEVFPERNASVDVVADVANLMHHVFDRVRPELVLEFDRGQKVDLLCGVEQVVQDQVVWNLIVLRRIVDIERLSAPPIAVTALSGVNPYSPGRVGTE